MKWNTARDYLVKLFERIVSIEKPVLNVEENDTNGVIVSDDFQELEEYLEEYPVTSGAQVNDEENNYDNINNQNGSHCIMEALKAFDGKTEKPSIRIVQYWEERKNENPDLFKIVSVLFVIRVTQTTVERAFSVLRIILGSHRTRLKSETLENILLVRLKNSLLKD